MVQTVYSVSNEILFRKYEPMPIFARTKKKETKKNNEVLRISRLNYGLLLYLSISSLEFSAPLLWN